MSRRLVSLQDRGFSVICKCVAVIRLREGGYAVGVQEAFRSGEDGAVWKQLPAARHRAASLAALHRLPVVESI
jgi:hypothetical protein